MGKSNKYWFSFEYNAMRLAVTNNSSLLSSNIDIMGMSPEFAVTITGGGQVAGVSLGTTGVTAGTYTSLVTDTKGRVTIGVNMTVTGDVTGTAAGASIALVLASVSTAGTYSNLVVDTKGRVTSARAINLSDVTTALGYIPVSTATLGATNGVSTLDANGRLTPTQFPTTSLSGDLTASTTASTITLTLASVGTAGTYSNFVTDVKGRVTSARAISSSDVTTGLGYTPVNYRAIFVSSYSGADPTGAAASDTAFASAHSAAVSSGKPLIIDGIYKLASATTITANLVFWPGFYLIQNAALTISGSMDAQAVLLFAGTGAVTFTTPGVIIPEAAPEWWGAIGNGTHDDTSALNAWWTAAVGKGLPGKLAAKTYLATSALTWDVINCQYTGFKVTGAGGQQSIIKFSSAVTTGPALLITNSYNSANITPSSPNNSFYPILRDFGIQATCTAAAFQIGATNVTTAFNCLDITCVIVNNYSTSTSAVGTAFYFVLNSSIFMISNSGGLGYGDALLLDKVQFCTFINGSVGNATNGIHIVGTYTYGNSFFSIDNENVSICLVNNDPNSINNVFSGGQWNYTTNAANIISAGSRILFEYINLSPATAGLTTFVGAQASLAEYRAASGNSIITWGEQVSGGLSADTLSVSGSTIMYGPAQVNGATGTTRQFSLTTAGSTRWAMLADSSTESGSNAGSNLYIARYSDTGSMLGSPISIARATGTVSITGGLYPDTLSVAGTALVSGAATLNAGLSVTGQTTSNGILAVNGAAGTLRQLQLTTAGSPRWNFMADTTPESGSNVGSNLFIGRYSDSGALLSNPISISRASGTVSITGGLYPDTLTVSGSSSLNGIVAVSGAAATTRSITMATSGTARWAFITDSSSESGSNAGSNFSLYRYSDAGALLSAPISISRSTGYVSITGGLYPDTLSVAGASTLSGTTTLNAATTVNSTLNVTGLTTLGTMTASAITIAANPVLTSVALSGDVTGTGGSAITTTLASVGSAGSYDTVTTDVKGRVISGVLLVNDGYQIGTIPVGAGTTGTIPLTTTAAPVITAASTLFTKAITPSGTTSKIKIHFSCFVDCTVSNVITFLVYRGSTVIGGTQARVASTATTGEFPQNIVLTLFDTPGTTASTTYTVYYGAGTAGTTYINRGVTDQMGSVMPSYYYFLDIGP